MPKKPAYSVPDFARFCAELTLDTGKPLKLEPFQRTLLRNYFKGTMETVVLLPSDNGRTPRIAGRAPVPALHSVNERQLEVPRV